MKYLEKIGFRRTEALPPMVIDLRLILLAKQMEKMVDISRESSVQINYEPNSKVFEDANGTLTPVFDTRRRNRQEIPGATYFFGPRIQAQVSEIAGQLVLQGIWDEKIQEAELFLLTTQHSHESYIWRTEEGVILESPYEALKNLTAGVNEAVVFETTSRGYRSALDGLLEAGIHTLNNWSSVVVHQQRPQVRRSNFLLK
jgi:hypothetical protein